MLSSRCSPFSLTLLSNISPPDGEFFEMLGEKRSPYTDALFQLIDIDGSGTISFDEFVQAISVYCMCKLVPYPYMYPYMYPCTQPRVSVIVSVSLRLRLYERACP